MTEISLDSEITNIPRVRLAEIITEKLAEALLGGKILPGEKLPSEASISESFKVSKPIAREALRMLDAAGLVTSSHGKHTRAKELNGEFNESSYSNQNKKKILFFNLGPKNQWNKLIDKNFQDKINSSFKKDLEFFDYA